MNRLPPAADRIGSMLARQAELHPDRPAIEYKGLTLSYGQLDACVSQCARAFLALGLQRGDRIATLSSPRPEAYISFLAAARLGLLWLGLNPKYQQRELSYVVGDAQPKLLICLESLDGRDYAADIEAMKAAAPSIDSTAIIGLQGEASSSFYEWLARAGSSVGDHRLQEAAALAMGTDPALLVYTSGSSGKPKGVLLRQRELLVRSHNQHAQFPTSKPPVLINPLPINHIGGMHFLGLYTLVGGGCLRLADKFSAAQFVDALASGDVSVFFGLPTMIKMIVDEPAFKPALLGKLEWLVFSGAAMSVELIEMIKSSGCKVGLTYGMTETCGSVTYARHEASVEQLANTIGRPVPDGEVRVAEEDGTPCAVDVPGEIQVRPEFCMGGYLNRPEATREAYTPDGWLRTGDSAVLRADGHIRFIGRRSEMFKSGGYNVYPREVELVLESLPTVAIAAVVGVPDPLFDEVGWAYVVPVGPGAVTDAALREFCRKELAPFKVPKRFILCDELPLLPIGKVDKVGLRRAAREQVEGGALQAPTHASA